MTFDFNIEDVQVSAAQTARDVIPDGEYLVVIADANKDFFTPKSNQSGLNMEYDIQTGTYEGKKITELLLYSNADVVKSKVSQIAVAIGITGSFTAKDVAKFPGKRITVVLKSKQVGDKTYQNVVKYISSEQPEAAAALPWKR